MEAVLALGLAVLVAAGGIWASRAPRRRALVAWRVPIQDGRLVPVATLTPGEADLLPSRWISGAAWVVIAPGCPPADVRPWTAAELLATYPADPGHCLEILK